MIRGQYEPATASLSQSVSLASEIDALSLDAESLLSRYTTLVYYRTGSYLSAARKLGLDRRTVKAKVDPAYLASLRAAS